MEQTEIGNRAGRAGADKAANGTDARILEAAELLFIDKGFDAVSVNDVALAAGVNKALVFYYFNNKQELFDTVLGRYYEAQATALIEAFRGATGSGPERLHAGVDAYMDFLERNPGYPRLIQREVCTSARNLDRILQYMEPLEQWGESLFGPLLPRTGPMSARQLFVSFFGLIVNYYTYAPLLERLWGEDPMSEPARAERRAHVHAVIDALLLGLASLGVKAPDPKAHSEDDQ